MFLQKGPVTVRFLDTKDAAGVKMFVDKLDLAAKLVIITATEESISVP